LFVLGLTISFLFLRWAYRQGGDDPQGALNPYMVLIVAVVVGARLGHILFYDDMGAYIADPARIFSVRKGGLASHGGALAVLTVLIVWARWVRKVPLRLLLDRAAFGVPVMGICVRLGNFLNSEILGRATDVPWAIVFERARPPEAVEIPAGLSSAALAYLPDNIPRHPSQLYEIAMNAAVLLVLYLVFRHYRSSAQPRPLGLMTGLMFTLYMGLRIVLEGFKEYQILDHSGLTMGQWLSIPFALAGFVCLWAALWGPWRQETATQFVRPKPATDVAPVKAKRTGRGRARRK